MADANKGGKVAIVVSRELADKVAMLGKVGKRPYLVHSLIHSYGLLKLPRVLTVPLLKAEISDMLEFHSKDYLDFLARTDDDDDVNDEEMDEYGLGYDCPRLPDMLDWCQVVAGGSLTAAQVLLQGKAKIAINWCGGWHHAHRDEAAGFCYVNDCVLAIHRLQRRFRRVLYIDLDVHHGDAVEEAFSSTDQVATFSIHKHEAGFYPGTGADTDIGYGKGRGYAVNLPLSAGLTDEMFLRVFSSVLPRLAAAFKPQAVVVQCGADCLSGDPCGGFSLSLEGPTKAVTQVASWGLPMLVLGGGGYNPCNSARLWTNITAALLGHSLDPDIPDSDPFFTSYGPDFELAVSKGCRKNTNTEEQVQRLIEDTKDRIRQLAPAAL